MTEANLIWIDLLLIKILLEKWFFTNVARLFFNLQDALIARENTVVTSAKLSERNNIKVARNIKSIFKQNITNLKGTKTL